MVLDRFGAHLEDQGDRFGCLTFGNELQNLTLPVGEFFQGRFLVGQVLNG